MSRRKRLSGYPRTGLGEATVEEENLSNDSRLDHLLGFPTITKPGAHFSLFL